MFILPIKSRRQVLSGRDNYERAYKGVYFLFIISQTPPKNAVQSKKYRATDFVRFLAIVSKKISRKAVIRNKLRRRIKEAFRLVDKQLLQNKYDYQMIVRRSIFRASMQDIKEEIEKCLKDEVLRINLEEERKG